MTRIPIAPSLLQWARERARVPLDELTRKFPKLPEWEHGTLQPTLKQIEAFASAVHVPVGYLFLPVPPVEPLPLPDFRTISSRIVHRPSPDLLDTIHVCQERQNWYREFARIAHQPQLEFVGSTTIGEAHEIVAEDMREKLSFDIEDRRLCSTWTDALRMFIRQADKLGILVMVSGIVLNDTHRPLDPEEFRGFALADKYAPLVFVNGADTKAAQMFTLAHELAHLWIGTSALSDSDPSPLSDGRQEEIWCNRVAAEFLVPLSHIQAEIHDNDDLDATLTRLARTFKVSTLVILRRLLDAGKLNRDEYSEAWRKEIARLRLSARRGSGGGNFYNTAAIRFGRRFTRALIESTVEGKTLYRDAFRMLGISKTSTFNELGRGLGVLA